MIDTHDCILNGNTITIEPAIKSECDCSNVKLTLSTVCRHACNDDKVHVKVDFDDVTNKPYALTYVDNMYKMLEDLGMDDLSGFVTNDDLSGFGYALQSDVEKRINDVVEVVVRDYALKDEIPSLEGYVTDDKLVNEINDVTDFISETYARKEEMPDTSNLATKDEIVTEFKTINGQEITGTGNIEISGGSGETIDTSNFVTKDEMSNYPNRNYLEDINQAWNFREGIYEHGQYLSNRYMLISEMWKYALRKDVESNYALKVDIPDTSNLATKDEIITEFKTINGQEITGTGNIEISGGSGETIDKSNFARTDTANTFNGNNVFEYTNYDSGCATFNGRTTFKDEINIEIDSIPKEDISNGIQCDMKQTKGQVATLYTGHILPPQNDTSSHNTNVINFGVGNNMKFIDHVGLYINGENLTDTYARKDEIPSLEGYAKTTDIPDTSNFATKDDVNALSNNITNNYALKDEIPDTSNLATKDEIVTEFKTINGQEITGTGNIEIKTDIDTTNLFWVGTQDEYNALSDYTTYEFYMIKRT